MLLSVFKTRTSILFYRNAIRKNGQEKPGFSDGWGDGFEEGQNGAFRDSDRKKLVKSVEICEVEGRIWCKRICLLCF